MCGVASPHVRKTSGHTESSLIFEKSSSFERQNFLSCNCTSDTIQTGFGDCTHSHLRLKKVSPFCFIYGNVCQ
jgi:hypothetical protein